jgi:hypothetical protein
MKLPAWRFSHAPDSWSAKAMGLLHVLLLGACKIEEAARMKLWILG